MSLVKQLVEEIEEIQRKPKWKQISEEYPLASNLKHIIVWDGRKLMILKSKVFHIGLGEVDVLWSRDDGKIYSGQNRGCYDSSLAKDFNWWLNVDCDFTLNKN